MPRPVVIDHTFLPEPPISADSPGMAAPQDIELPPSPSDEPDPMPERRRRRAAGTTTRLENHSATSPTPSNSVTIQLPYRPRNHSPSRSQMRPHSVGGISGVPLMQRAHSSPGVDSSGRLVTPYTAPRRPSSPLHAGRRRSPLRSAMEESYPGTPSWSGLNIEPNIPEHAELELSAEGDLSPLPATPSYPNTFPRTRRRPTSPLHQSASAPSLHARAVSPHLSGRTSPSPAPPKYAYDLYPASSFSSASSMPSTPTSLRSRSPSISSLETIEDTPDAEEAAMLEDEEAKQKSDDGEGANELRRRSSLDLRGNNLRSNKERKRWSVCGAERRADFSLEPIEE